LKDHPKYGIKIKYSKKGEKYAVFSFLLSYMKKDKSFYTIKNKRKHKKW
jgi:hypothetical protein